MPEIHTIDLQYLGIPQAIAAYVIVGSDGPVLIETGPASTIGQLTLGLTRLGLRVSDVRHAVVTHIHLDHAGAAGHLATNGTTIYVHEFGAKHLIDLSKLVESATRIYGEQMDRLWGRIKPVPRELVKPLRDGDRVVVGDIELLAVETPGHARHHHALVMDTAAGRTCFAGDIAGISVPGIPEPPQGRFIAVPTPPPEFDLHAWSRSLARLAGMNLRDLYLTHFGKRSHVGAHLDRLNELIHEHAAFVRQSLEQGESRSSLLDRYVEWNRRAAMDEGLSEADVGRYVSTNLLTMNIDGMIRYWNAQRNATTSH